MNAYWMNELVYEGTTCTTWAVPVLATLLGVFVIGTVVAIVMMNRN
jgi:hypothetical protein